MICSHGGFWFAKIHIFNDVSCIGLCFFFFFDLFLEKQLSDGLGNVLRIWWVIVNGIVPYFFWKLQKAT